MGEGRSTRADRGLQDMGAEEDRNTADTQGAATRAGATWARGVVREGEKGRSTLTVEGISTHRDLRDSTPSKEGTEEGPRGGASNTDPGGTTAKAPEAPHKGTGRSTKEGDATPTTTTGPTRSRRKGRTPSEEEGHTTSRVGATDREGEPHRRIAARTAGGETGQVRRTRVVVAVVVVAVVVAGVEGAAVKGRRVVGR
jgi:hypothetical protein